MPSSSPSRSLPSPSKPLPLSKLDLSGTILSPPEDIDTESNYCFCTLISLHVIALIENSCLIPNFPYLCSSLVSTAVAYGIPLLYPWRHASILSCKLHWLHSLISSFPVTEQLKFQGPTISTTFHDIHQKYHTFPIYRFTPTPIKVATVYNVSVNTVLLLGYCSISKRLAKHVSHICDTTVLKPLVIQIIHTYDTAFNYQRLGWQTRHTPSSQK